MQRELGFTVALPQVVREREGRQVLRGRPRPWLTSLLTLAVDAAALLLSGLLALTGWLLVNPSINTALFLELWPALGLFIVGYMLTRLYSVGMSPIEELKRLSYVSTAVFAVVLIVLFLVKALDAHSRGVLLLFWLLTLVSVPLARSALRLLAARRVWWGAPVMILGAGKTGALVIRRLLANPELGLKPVACFDDDPALRGESLSGVPVVGDLAYAAELAQSCNVKHAVVAMPGVSAERLQEIVFKYAQAFAFLTVVPNFFGLASVGLATREFAGVVGLYTRQNLLIPANKRLKRVLDLLLLLPLAVVAVPLVGVLALLVMLVSPGNPFYAQERVGFGGRRFRLWKLRTMYKNADALLQKHLAANPEARVEWERYFKLSRDPRILPGVGWLLRKTSLDELPQLWNIARAEMSFVGPRPFPEYHLNAFSDEFQGLRRSVIPGLTGLWQVSERSNGDVQVQQELDSFYIRNWSLWMDLYLLWRTPWAVLFGKGAR